MATKSTPHYDHVEGKFYSAPALADLPTDGSSTVTQLETQINTIVAALRTAGVIASN